MQPEHISNVIPRVMNGANGSFSIVPRERRTRTLPELITVLEEIEATDNPDVVTEASALRVTNDGLIDVPQLGAFKPTDWSLLQIARFAGVKLDRWFENADGPTRADELNRRFTRSTSAVRLRTRRSNDPAMVPPGAAGILRALVTPTYAPISDVRAATHLARVLGRGERELPIVRVDITSRSTTFVVRVGDPFHASDRETASVGEIWGTVLFMNSGTGFSCLSVALQLLRLVCKNGMFCPLEDPLALKRRHRGITDESLGELITEGLAGLPEKFHRSHRRLLASTQQRVAVVEQEVRDILDHSRLPQRLVKPILDAYGREPHASAFGVSQAMTLAAQSLTAEERVDLERAAGRYLATFAEA